MFGMSRSVQTMTFMPLASVVVRTWSIPGTRAGGADLLGLVAAPVAAPTVSKRDAHRARTKGYLGMQHLNRVRTLYTEKEKRRTRGKSFAAPKKRTPGKSCSQSFVRGVTC